MRDIVVSVDELKRLRKLCGFKQLAMAHALGMSLRAYSDIETGVASTRRIHILAAREVVNLAGKGFELDPVRERMATEDQQYLDYLYMER